jgi:lipoprotein signal peptidase
MKNIVLILFLVFLDQLTKYFFYNLKCFSKIFLFTPVFNKGISRGIDIFPKIFIVLLTFIFLGVLFYFWHKKKIEDIVFVLIFA